MIYKAGDATPTMFNYGDTVTLTLGGKAWQHVLAPGDVAVMIDGVTGEPDVAQNLDTAISMILQGYVAIPVGDDNRERYGKTFESERISYKDCWGIE